MHMLRGRLASAPLVAGLVIATCGIALGEPKAAEPKALLELFDRNFAEARVKLAGVSDETLRKPWTLLVNGHKAFTMSKAEVLRTFVMNHIIHHRAQLGVYLRLNDVPVPGLYGPSADEKSS